MNSFGEPTLQLRPTNPKENEKWMSLCKDPLWSYQKPDGDETLYYFRDWEWKEGEVREQSAEHKLVAALPEKYQKFHPGALAPEPELNMTISNSICSD